MTSRWSFHFRNTAGTFYTETTPANYCAKEVYPTTRNGATFGWLSAPLSGQDDNTRGDARISGRNVISTGVAFRVNLPDGPGTYKVWLSLSGLGTALSTGCGIYDGNGAAGAQGTSLLNIPLTALASGQCLDAGGNVQTIAAWIAADGGAYATLTFTADHFFVNRNAAGTAMYINCVEAQLVPVPLVDCTVTTENGAGSLSAVFSKDAPGKLVGKIASANGVQSFSVTGTGATYFTVVTYNGAPWLATTSTRLPDSYSSGITIRQTDPSGTHDTTFNPSCTNATARAVDTSILGLISSETWLRRAFIKAVTATERWKGYTGAGSPAIAGGKDFVAAGDAAFATVFNAITPDGTSWYRIAVQNGSWVGNLSLTREKDFGTGGLLIEPASGHDPLIQTQFLSFEVKGCHWRNTRMDPFGYDQNGSSQRRYSFSNDVNCDKARIIFENNRIGEYFNGAPSDTYDNWGSFYYGDFAESIQFINNTFDGVWTCMFFNGGRLLYSNGNTFNRVESDVHPLSAAYKFTTPRGIFADDYTYIEISNNKCYRHADNFTGLAGAPHGDWVQLRRLENYYSFEPYPNGNTGARWVAGNNTVNLTENRVYTCTGTTTAGGATAGVASGSPPSGTGTGIVCGGVVFDYALPYTVRTNIYILLENNAIHMSGNSTIVDGSTSPNIQFVQDNIYGTGMGYEIVAINNVCASPSSRGISCVEGICHAEFNGFVSPGYMPASLTPLSPLITTQTGKLRTRKNLVGYTSGALQITSTGAGTVYEDDNIGIDWTTNGGARRPQDFLKGSFTYANSKWGYALNDQTAAPADFMSDLSKLMHTLDGLRGAKLSEKYVVSAGGSNVTITINP